MARGVKSKLFWYELSEPDNDIASTQVAMLMELDEANVHPTTAGKVKPLTDLNGLKLIPAGLRVRKNEHKYGIQPRMVELKVLGDLTGTTCYMAPKFRKIRYPILTVAQWASIAVAFKTLDTSLPPANLSRCAEVQDKPYRRR